MNCCFIFSSFEQRNERRDLSRWRSGDATASDPRRCVSACLQRHQLFGSGGRRTGRHGWADASSGDVAIVSIIIQTEPTTRDIESLQREQHQ
eukprot:1241842-Rhodomonas_salina.1